VNKGARKKARITEVFALGDLRRRRRKAVEKDIEEVDQ
jgi:hypothetical protein